MARLADEWCASKAAQYAAASMYVPAGNTPKALYALWEEEKPGYLEGLRLVQMDEVLGEGEPGRFRKFFMEQLPSYAGRIAKPGEFQGPADLAILGLGRNGHVAFHEPGLPLDFRFGEVALTGSTCRSLGLHPPRQGLTHGLGHFMKCRAVLLIVAGSGKEEAWGGFRKGVSAYPVTALRKHADLTVLVDEELS